MAATYADKLAYLKANAETIANAFPGGIAITREGATGTIVSLGIHAYGSSPMTPDQVVTSGILAGYLPQ